MRIKNLETVVWIARLWSFRAAARRLYVSQSSVSACISSLADELRSALFDCSGRRAVLTAKGRQLRVCAREDPAAFAAISLSGSSAARDGMRRRC
ncbi:MAG: LysR family transcriptional regulator [Halomonas sp.]